MKDQAIEAAIPHRAPFLFLDALVDEGADWLTAEWTVPEDAAFLQGHFPGQPITPGVLLAEHAFQAAAVLISHALGGFRAEDGVPVLTRIRDARYRRAVAPGTKLTTRVEIVERVGPAYHLRASIAAGAQRVASLSFVLSASGALGRLDLG
jgi:3-hydroxymyristoyl/3-hydroxydecanoyl-(acyl carrier protein) dehydratase